MKVWFKRIFAKDKPEELSSSSEKRVKKIEQLVGFSIEEPSLFLKALRHRSTVSLEQYEHFDSYERLEFLGDSVLDLIIAEILFELFPTKDEGFLTKLRAKLVRGETLTKLSTDLGIPDLLEIGEKTNRSTIASSILADVFEALIAAIYLTNGYEKAFDFVKQVIDKHIDITDTVNTIDNHKSELLEYTQAKKISLPFYEVVTESGPGHNKIFDIIVKIDGEVLGRGIGKSKKKAEQEAAKNALEAILKS